MDFLSDIVSTDQVSTLDEDLEDHSSDFRVSGEGTLPIAVVYPESTEDVSRILKKANEKEIPVTPYALGTGLEGMAVPAEGGISLDMTRMDKIIEFRSEDFQIEVEPGLVGEKINDRAKKRGLFFPPLPTSGDISTIGGMAANDASGKHTVLYGQVQDWILQMEIVLASGEVIEVGSQAVKSSSGYNLKDLFVGSEGTLGVITGLTLELSGIPQETVRGRILFSDFDGAARCVKDIVQSGVEVAALEFVDELSLQMANAYLDENLSESPALFLEFHANHGVWDEVDFVRTILDSYQTSDVDFTDNPNEMDNIWEARKELTWAVASYKDELDPLQSGDVTVPISKFPELVRYVRKLGADEGYLIPCFGHAGDGNLHYTVLVDQSDDDHTRHGEELYRNIVERALELGGTATGEHGIGLGKKKFMDVEHGAQGVKSMRNIKKSLDPKNILNPGKIFPNK